MITSQSTKNISKALFKFQGIMPRIKRNSKNDYTKSNYVSWDDLVDAAIPYLQKCGLYFEQEEIEKDGYVTVSTRIVHAETDEFKHFEPVRIKESTQGNLNHNTGSSLTYAKRYSLTLALALRGTDQDLDGNYPENTNKKINNNDNSNKNGVKTSTNSKQTTYSPWAEKKVEQDNVMDLKEEEHKKKGIQKLVALCKTNGISDDMRYKITTVHTGKKSSKELTLDELRHVYKVILNDVRINEAL
jgi:hypothetical protein